MNQEGTEMKLDRTIYLVASGDLRPDANELCWPAQEAMEDHLVRAVQSMGSKVVRAHPFLAEKRHGFIDSQRYGMDIFRDIPQDAPLIVAEAVWQYSHHVLAGLTFHRGPILTVANWSGQWPGLVGLLNLNASLTKAGVAYSSLWSADFTDSFFLNGLSEWLEKGSIEHDRSHVHLFAGAPRRLEDFGQSVAVEIRKNKAILGVFDEGCMGMYNAIVPDHLLHATGIFKERLSQSALAYATSLVRDEEASEALDWLLKRGMQFHFGNDEKTELTRAQVLLQLKMYIASVRIADNFGCDAIGIQYQQGLKDVLPASDLAEGLLNNTERPPVYSVDGTRELYPGKALPHFNEVDECAGIDALVTHIIWSRLGLSPETTLHDLRYGERYGDEFVWVFQISGAAPPAHFVDGYRGASSERQPPMYFRLGGGTLKGNSRPGEIVWSRIYVEGNALKADLGRGTVLALPAEETERRWKLTTSQWPMMSTVLHGVSRDAMMAQHKANHIQVAYGNDSHSADEAMLAKAACLTAMGIEVSLCGVNPKS
jgi:hypothetical protein